MRGGVNNFEEFGVFDSETFDGALSVFYDFKLFFNKVSFESCCIGQVIKFLHKLKLGVH